MCHGRLKGRSPGLFAPRQGAMRPPGSISPLPLQVDHRLAELALGMDEIKHQALLVVEEVGLAIFDDLVGKIQQG